ncbi:MAG: hypothetical protein JWR43_2835 [Phenylobacterium sp.]|nr:hypothetical protein [Phenylobacterium sp.]
MYPEISDNIQSDIAKKVEFTDFYNKEGLYDHQEFVRRFLSPHTPYKGLLLFHSLGSGKSMACISVAVDHYEFDRKKCIIITKGDSGTDNFRRQILQYIDMKRAAFPGYNLEPKSVFEMEHYMSLSNKILIMRDEDVTEQFSNKILVFDEIHNVRKFGEGDGVYNSMMRMIKLSNNTRVLLATATPMINESSQIDHTLSLLSDDHNGIISFNSEVKNKPTVRYAGLPSEPSSGPHDRFLVHSSYMRGHQKEIYLRESSKGVPEDIYRGLVHVALFCFEDGSFGRRITEEKMRQEKVPKIISSMKTGAPKQVNYIRYVVKEEFRHELVGDGLRDASCKYHELMRLLEEENDRSPVFVFVEEVKGSGLLLLANVFEEHGYELYVGENLKTIQSGVKRYTFCVGSMDICPNNADRLEGFNSPLNSDGRYVRVLLGSRVIGESITLLNVRQFHAITPHWNDSAIEQAMGRVIRSNSHSLLPEEERVVDLYIHAALVEADGEVVTVDILKLKVCSEKQRDISSKEKELMEKAVDRYVFERTGTDASTFILYYMDVYMDPLVSKLEKKMKKAPGGEMRIDDLIEKFPCHPDIVMELFVRVVTQNIRIDGRYLREDNGILYLTEDPSTPLNFLRTPVTKTFPDRYRKRTRVPEIRGNVLESLRGLDISSKIAVFENECLRKSPREGVIGFFRNLSMCTSPSGANPLVYHILCYREKSEAYTAMLPIPKTLGLKTRVLKDGQWKYVEDEEEEREVIGCIRESIEKTMEEMDEYKVFGVISVIDNHMRLRSRELEDRERSSNDRRYIRKGRNLISMRKSELLEIRRSIYGDVEEGCPKVKDIVRDVEEYIVSEGRYIIL